MEYHCKAFFGTLCKNVIIRFLLSLLLYLTPIILFSCSVNVCFHVQSLHCLFVIGFMAVTGETHLVAGHLYRMPFARTLTLSIKIKLQTLIVLVTDS
jgi:hypothetical protein